MPIENESIRKVCPECSAEIAVYEGLRTWCEQCNWNVAGESQRVDEGFLARRYVRIGERYGKAVLETLKLTPVHELRPGWPVRKIVAFLLAGSVHFLSAALLVVGILLIALGFPEVSLIVLGLSSCAFAWLMRLQPGKMPAKDIASRADFPALYGLVNAVGRELGGAPIDHIVVNEDFNAAYAVVGWRRVPVLWIGLPFWMALGPQERVALLGHEIAHGVNGDSTRSFMVGSAVGALDEWIGFLRGPLERASDAVEILGGSLTWVLSIPFAALQSLLAQLLWLDKQQAEYFADYLGSTISGTEAAVSALLRIGCGEHLDEVLLRHGYSRSQSGAYILGRFRQRIASLPEREWQRMARASQREGARLDASHPPTPYRVEFLRAHVVSQPKIVATESTMNPVDAELDKLREILGQRLIARIARD